MKYAQDAVGKRTMRDGYEHALIAGLISGRLSNKWKRI
jgi:hypothetical protein